MLSRSGLVDHGVDHSLDPSFTIFQPCFWLRKRLECDTCTFDRVSFCHVEHCQLTTCSVWHEGLPDHFRPCQNTWAPHYAAARDWLKSKGVSALTDRSGVVYWELDKRHTIFSITILGKQTRHTYICLTSKGHAATIPTTTGTIIIPNLRQFLSSEPSRQSV